MPIGMNATPMATRNGSTDLAVNIGCHAGSCCCLNFVSESEKGRTLKTSQSNNQRLIGSNKTSHREFNQSNQTKTVRQAKTIEATRLPADSTNQIKRSQFVKRRRSKPQDYQAIESIKSNYRHA
jgi:hypothetical protein